MDDKTIITMLWERLETAIDALAQRGGEKELQVYEDQPVPAQIRYFLRRRSCRKFQFGAESALTTRAW